MNEVFKFLNKLFKSGDRIVVGVSGGPDSMVLLYVLNSLKDKFNLTIICAHVNHNTRVECEEEKKFVENYAVFNNDIFEYMKIENYKNNKFSEDEARRKRYAFFDSLVKKYQAQYLMTAHHGNDLEETILMRIVRGSNLKGYMGINLISVKDNYNVVRPLLFANKKDILDYVKDKNIEYVVDKSNDSLKYTRNRYRKQLLPFLEKEDEVVHLKFLKFSQELEKYVDYISEIVNKKINDIYINGRINVDKLLEEDEFIRERIVEKVIEIIQKDNILNINDSQFRNIMALTLVSGSKKINLSDGFVARKSYNYLYIEKDKNIESYEYILDEDKEINNFKIAIINNSNEKSNYVIRLNSQELKLPLKVRPYKNGDKMKIKGLNGTKKVKDIYIDNKIDLVKRKERPVVVDSQNTVIWLPGLKKSIFDKEISEKCDIILKCTEELE